MGINKINAAIGILALVGIVVFGVFISGCTGQLPGECTESWSCGDWSACSAAGIQARTCIDANYCGTTMDEPSISQTCTPTTQPNATASCPSGAAVLNVGQSVTDDSGSYKATLESITIPTASAPSKAIINLKHIYSGHTETTNYGSKTTEASETPLTWSGELNMGGNKVDVYVCEVVSGLSPLDSKAKIKMAVTPLPIGATDLGGFRIYVGQNVSDDKYTFKLETVSITYGKVGSTANIKIYDAATGAYTGQTASLLDGETKTVGGGADFVMLHAYEVLAGMDPLDSWARIGIFTKTMDLQNGYVIDSSENRKWKTYLTWGSYSSGPNIILKSINISRISMPVAVSEGDSINITENSNAYQLYFKGQTLTSGDFERLTVTYEPSISYTNANMQVVSGNDAVCFASETKNAFKLADGSTKKKVCIIGQTAGAVIYEKNSGAGDYYFSQSFSGNISLKYSINNDAAYDQNIEFDVRQNKPVSKPNIIIYEYADKDRTKNISWQLSVDTINKGLYVQAATDQVTYQGLNVEDGTATSSIIVKANYVSQKGSKLVSKTKTQAVFNMAKKLGELEYDLIAGTSSYTIKTYMYGFIDVDTTDDQVRDGNQRIVDENNWAALAPTSFDFSNLGGGQSITTKYSVFVNTLRASEFDTTYNKYKTYIYDLEYVATFNHPRYPGLPACANGNIITNTSATVSSAMSACQQTNGADLAESEAIKMTLLGKEWVLLDMDPVSNKIVLGLPDRSG
jgi:hypothetical protein